MDDSGLFTAALGLASPWRVDRVQFDPGQKRLDLYLDFPRGARFGWRASQGLCASGVPGCTTPPIRRGGTCDFFQHRAFLHARLPRVRCPEHGVRQGRGAVGAGGGGAGFTLLLFEGACCWQVRGGDAGYAGIAEMVEAEHDTRTGHPAGSPGTGPAASAPDRTGPDPPATAEAKPKAAVENNPESSIPKPNLPGLGQPHQPIRARQRGDRCYGQPRRLPRRFRSSGAETPGAGRLASRTTNPRPNPDTIKPT